MKVSLFIVGIQKCATTSLHHHLAFHPEFCKPTFKELHFFDDETQDWNCPKYKEYESNFKDTRIRFDATPIYAFWPNSLERIKAYNKLAKIVVIFRDPIERIVSHWNMNTSLGWETLSFSDAIRSNNRLLSEDGLRTFSYIERTMYGKQCERILSLFPKDQIHFIKTENLLLNRKETLYHLATFCNVRNFADTHFEENKASTKIVPSFEDIEFIKDKLKKDIQRFTELTEIKFNSIS